MIAEDKRLFGRKEIAAYLRGRYGFGSVWYVSAMIKAGLPVERGNSITVAEVEKFLAENPSFRGKKAYSANICQRLPTFANTCQHFKRG